ncbi:MAG: ABC transporter ATP-binding protein [Planctomycetaceae bacterium]
MPTATEPILEIEGLKTYFRTEAGVVKAVDDISLKLKPGQTLGLVGESGSGKSVTSYTILRLLPELTARIEAGRISFLGRDLVRIPKNEMCDIRGKDISMIFQEPGTSLNPVYRVGWQVMEAILLHQKVSKEEARQRTIKLFEEVGIPEPERRIDSFPHEMSGGQKQRVMIAMALSCNPKILIADEPTTALDVTIQAQILDLIRKLRDERGMSVLFITHDLGVIAELADDVAVMFHGKIVEYGDAVSIFKNPKHPYTNGLIACRPKLASSFRRLPTVADFMEMKTAPDGEIKIIEKSLSDAAMEKLIRRGRGRMLSPIPEIEQQGYKWNASDYPEGTTTIAAENKPLLEVTDLKVYYPIRKGLLRKTVGHVKAVDGISFRVYKGQTLGLVGESGCGKTTTGRALIRLIPITDGKVSYNGRNVRDASGESLQKFRRKMQIIFQDPYNSLNPRLTVEAMLTEAMSVHRLGTSRRDRQERAAHLLEEVGLKVEHLRRYPHEFSGGQRQRLGVARALAVEPEFIICDESVSALDVSVQAQVLNLLKDLQEQHQLTYIFISHDLSVVKFMSDMMAVMNAGKIVEYGPADLIYANPREDYTKRLISAIPEVDIEKIESRRTSRQEQLGRLSK